MCDTDKYANKKFEKRLKSNALLAVVMKSETPEV